MSKWKKTLGETQNMLEGLHNPLRSGKSRRSWKTWLSRTMSCIVRCYHDPAPDKQEKMNGWKIVSWCYFSVNKIIQKQVQCPIKKISFSYLSPLFYLLQPSPVPLRWVGAEDSTYIKEDGTILRYGWLCQTNYEDGGSPGFLQGLPAKYTGHHPLCWHWLGCVWGACTL